MALFFTADTHFGDHRTLNLYKRPFASVADMDAALAAAWNRVVGPEDDIWHLGDFAPRKGRAAEVLPLLNGVKHLVYGNNDGPDTLALPHWASVQPYAELEVDGLFLVLCHYPFRSWNRMHKGALNLHGHSHGRLAPLPGQGPKQVDVGVDVWDYAPVSLDRLVERLRRR
jgi:calcineurin-like phosphoesterase family protein